MPARLSVVAVLLFSGAAFAAYTQPAGPAGSKHSDHMAAMAASSLPKENQQSAFAALTEIVSMLDADPATDWSKVNIESLRQHLIDMNNVTLGADVVATQIAHGMRFAVTGTSAVQASIRRMVTAHAATMDGVRGWHFQVEGIENGAMLTTTVTEPNDLGFIGLMTVGMHHQAHHMAIARGNGPHE